MRLSAINTRLSWKTKFAAAKIQKQPSSRSVKEGLQGPAQVLSCECCETVKNFYFEKHQWTALSENQHFRQYPNFNILLKLILNFAMAKWFCYVTCFAKIFLLLLFHNTYQVICYHFFIVELLLKVRSWKLWSPWWRTIRFFMKKYISKHRAGCSCNLSCKKRRISIT